MELEAQIEQDKILDTDTAIYEAFLGAVQAVIDRLDIASISQVRQYIKKNPVYGKFSTDVSILRAFFDLKDNFGYKMIESNNGKTIKMQVG